MTSGIYEIELTVGVDFYHKAQTINCVRAALDTCGGCNLIRRNQIPPGIAIQPLSRPTKIAAAQGQDLHALGEVRLQIRVGTIKVVTEAEFLVVEQLVVPVLLGTPCTDRNVFGIDPKDRRVDLQFDPDGDSFSTPLFSSYKRNETAILVVSSRPIPAFTEAWVECRTNRTGPAVLCPNRVRDRLVQAKNGVLELPPCGKMFRCLVANFSRHTVVVRKGQVVGYAEAVQEIPVCAVPISAENDKPDLMAVTREEADPLSAKVPDMPKDWQEVVRSSATHLPDVQKNELIKMLNMHQEMWDGHLGKIERV